MHEAKILDGKATADAVCEQILQVIRTLPSNPGLAVIQVGNHPASESYVRTKTKVAAKLGIKTFLHQFSEAIATDVILRCIDQLNDDARVDGILVQLPLPQHMNVDAILSRIDPRKDVDGFHAHNLGRLVQESQEGFVPCTSLGILELLKRHHIETTGRHVVVAGRSLIVGRPTALLFLQKSFANATVTVVHTATRHIEDFIRQADILIAAIGQAQFIQGAWIKEGAVVVDVGIHRVTDAAKESRLVGDVVFEDARRRAAHITPVPGGVGPMTVAMLMRNTLTAYRRHHA